MPSSIEQELEELVARYVSGDVSLREFQERFVPRAWSIDAAESGGAAQLANEVELLLAEFSNGHWTEDELKAELGQRCLSVHAAQTRLDVAQAPWLQSSTSSSQGRQPAAATRYFGVPSRF
ncbi:MAG: hypothetical protein A2X52_06025 [Candidatus Rokubacteria bacterium GWC2_70_16]|nr:MAG: hypothetical protein A2X52_06025 [Candidatus Rokubacteria bacterium GWC2_70_16]OGL15325.1 MAG: hypothetical protein A3K12_09195 [Candidatus Rokubacteria bacterium RIFCSPLOWO2_12_FULL_71_19]